MEQNLDETKLFRYKMGTAQKPPGQNPEPKHPGKTPPPDKSTPPPRTKAPDKKLPIMK